MSHRLAAAILLSTAALSSPASGQRVNVDLPAGTLGAAVDRLALQAGWSISIDDPALPRRAVPRIRGRMTAAAALRLLADRAGGQVHRISAFNWRLRPRAPRRERPVTVHPPPGAAPPDRQADVIVLASKRATPYGSFAGSVEVIDPVPTAIEAGTSALVARSTIISSTYRGAGREKLFLRGIADSSFPGRLQSVTGLYFGDVRLTYSATDPDLQLYDMTSVEVLQGPQGTLYGSGSLAGLIRLNPAMPKRGVVDGSVGGGVSAIAHGGIGRDVDAVVNLPLTEDVAVRAVGYSRTEAGFIDKPAVGRDVNRTHIDGGRVMARWWVNANWSVDAIGMIQRIDGRDAQYATIGAPPLTDLARIASPSGSNYAAGHLVVNGRIGDVTLVSATGIASQRLRERASANYGAYLSIADTERHYDLTTHETRLSSSVAGGGSWVAGIAYTNASGASVQRYPRSNFPFTLTLDEAVSEIALFAEGALPLASFVSLGAGARAVQATTMLRSDVSLSPGALAGPTRTRERWLLPTASILLTPTRSLSGYLRYQQGRRAGAGILSDVGTTSDERMQMVDGGVRWESDNGWNAAASLMHSRWRQLTASIFEGFFGSSSNNLGDWSLISANAMVSGTVVPGLGIDAAMTLNQARPIGRPPGAIRVRLPDVAGVIARVGVNWKHPVSRALVARVAGWVRYEGESEGALYGLLAGTQGDYFRTGLSIDLDHGRDRMSLTIDNLLDGRGTRYRFGDFGRPGSIVTPLQPLTARLGYRRGF